MKGICCCKRSSLELPVPLILPGFHWIAATETVVKIPGLSGGGQMMDQLHRSIAHRRDMQVIFFGRSPPASKSGTGQTLAIEARVGHAWRSKAKYTYADSWHEPSAESHSCCTGFPSENHLTNWSLPKIRRRCESLCFSSADHTQNLDHESTGCPTAVHCDAHRHRQ